MPIILYLQEVVAGLNWPHYFGKIALAGKMSSNINNNPFLNKNHASIYILIACLYIFACAYPVYAAVELQATGTVGSGTMTPSQTGTPTSPSLTFTPSATPSETPTTTLLPLPAFTLIFPAATSTSTVVESPRPLTTSDTPKLSGSDELNTLSPRIRLLVILLVMLWVFLAGFVIIYTRQFK